MGYRVTLRDTADHNLCCGGTPKHYMSLAQAIHGAKLLAYDKLEAFGKLDTLSAHEVMRQIHDASDILQERVMRERSLPISNTRYTLTIERTGTESKRARRRSVMLTRLAK